MYMRSFLRWLRGRFVGIAPKTLRRPFRKRSRVFRPEVAKLEDRLAPSFTPVQTYFVPVPEQDLRNAFLTLYPGTGTQFQSVISIVTTGNNTQIVYDHWEDGYEANITSPVQPSTLIWGDGNLSNGIAPGTTLDLMPAGHVIPLQNLVSLPRNPSTILFDGADRFATSQAVSVTRAAWATSPGSVLGHAVDLYYVSRNATNFLAPVGVNTPNQNSMFEYSSLIIMAAENNTFVQVDKDADGTFETVGTLSMGQTMHVTGIHQGARVVTSKAVQVHEVTGDIGATYESRSFTLAGTNQWASSYFSPVTTTRTTDPLTIFLFNPTAGTLTVHYETLSGTGTLAVPSKGTTHYVVPLNTGVRFHTPGNEPFYAVGAMDSDASNNQTYDWGFRLVPESYLTPAAVVGWGPGSSDLTGNGSPVWVTAVAPTRIYVDYDGNPATGPLTDPNGSKYDVHHDVVRLQSVRIFDPDKNHTGMRVYTTDGTRLTAAWGEDPTAAAAGNPFLDMGTVVPPLPISYAQKTAILWVDHDNSGTVTPGDDIRFTITVVNDGVVPLGNVIVSDIIPAGTSYVANSTTLNLSAVPDQTAPATPFPLDLITGSTLDIGLNIGNIPVGGSSFVQFVVKINNPYNGPPLGIQNSAKVNTGTGTITVTTLTPVSTTPGQVVFSIAAGTMTQAAHYLHNTTTFLTVTDPDPNVNPAVADTITVLVTNPHTGDFETVTLTETGPNTGVFTASLPTSNSTGLGSNDGTIHAFAGNVLTVTYTDPYNPSDTSSDTVPIVAPSVIKQLYFDADAASGDFTGDLDRVLPTGTTTLATGTLSAGSTITVGTVTTGASSSLGTGAFTFNVGHTVGSGSDRLLLVGITVEDDGTAGITIGTVTYAGNNLTLVGSASSGEVRTQIWRLISPPVGVGTVTISGTGAGTGDEIAVGAIHFFGVDQTTPLGTFTSATGTTSPATLTLASTAGQLVFGVLGLDDSRTATSAGGQTQRWNIASQGTAGDGIRGAAATQPGGGSVTLSWTLPTADNWALGAVRINPASSAATVTFTQNPTMASTLTLAGGGIINVTAHVNVVSGAMPTNPSVTAVVRHGSTIIGTLTGATYTGASGPGLGTITWSGTLGSSLNIPPGAAVAVDIISTQAGVGFQVLYDSAAHPSFVSLPVTNFIDVTSLSVFDGPFSNDGNNTNDGNLITGTLAGQTVYVRVVVTDPFGAYDINPAGNPTLVITDPGSGTFTLSPTVHSGGFLPAHQKIYEYTWTTGLPIGNYSIFFQAFEGFEGTISDTAGSVFTVNMQDLGTPAIIRFTNASFVDVTTYPALANVYLEVTDIDQNTNPAVVETVQAVITTSTGDSQLVTLTETGPNTGIFRMLVGSGTVTLANTGSPIPNDFILLGPAGTLLTATYVDPNDPSDVATDTANVVSPPANQPPVIDFNGTNDTGTSWTATYNENDPPLLVTDTDAIITDADSTSMGTLTLSLGGIVNGNQEVLAFNSAATFPLATSGTLTVAAGTITFRINYNAGTGVFTITNDAGGTMPLPSLNTLLQNIRYLHTSDNPTAGNRTITGQVSDDTGLFSNFALSTIAVNPVNDPPVLDLDGNNSSGVSGTGYQTTYVANSTPVPIADIDTTITDVDSATITSATVVLTNAQTNDVLAISGVLPGGISATITPGLGFITVSLTGAATLAQYQTALNQIVFSNSGVNPSLVPRNITAVVNDGTDSSNIAIATINLSQVADLSITKTNNQTAVIPGTSVTYVLVVSNAGPSTVTSVTATDPVPGILSGATFTPSTGTYTAGTGVWTGLSLGAGGVATLTLSGTVSGTATGTITNTATVAPPAGV
ncbi:MAG: hypothetical protein RMJ52_17980, partial [Gemmataceae bacterium]|nr:hypothetical protein [Gemmataceae bacterium]